MLEVEDQEFVVGPFFDYVLYVVFYGFFDFDLLFKLGILNG